MKQKGSNEISVMIDGVKWVPFVTRNLSFWHQNLSDRGIFHHSKDFGLVSKAQLFVTINGIETHIFSNSQKLEGYGHSLLKIIETKRKIKKLKIKYENFASWLLEATEKCVRKTMPKTWDDFTDIYSRFCAGLALTAYLGVIGAERLTNRLKELGFDDQKIPNLISVITYPEEHTPLFNSQLYLLDIAKDVQSKRLSNTEINDKLQKWLLQYSHIPVNFCGEPWSLKDAQEQLNSLLKKDCKKEIDLLIENHRSRILERDYTLEKIRDKKLSLLAYALQTSTYLNEFRKNVFSKVSLEIRPIFKLVAEKVNLSSWNKCYFLTSEEIREIINGKLSNVDKMIDKRKVVGMKMGVNGKQSFLTKEELKKVVDLIDSIKGKSKIRKNGLSTVNGFSANKGIVRGIAKIIISPKEFGKLLPGEILITIMTSVDFIPIMEKAAAFVTNEGGISSHASIVAREMNKPCIIGTKIATSVFKDGDLVEVDANKGIVRKL